MNDLNAWLKERRTCTTCGHTINNHDANECWKTTDGEQCDCGWMGVPNE